VICLAKPGDQVRRGQPLLELRADDAGRFDGALAALVDAVTIGDQDPGPAPSPIIERIPPPVAQ
jgi:thymidine phosphorylase